MIVLITDGYDEHSQSSLDEAVAAVKEAGVTVYTVGIGGVAGISMKGHDELKAIAAGTGGRAFFPSRPTELPNVYDVLATDAQLRYLVTYTPTNQKRDGTWRTISLRTYDESLIVKARTGYFAPKPPPVRPVLEFTAMDPQNQYLDVTQGRPRRLRGRRRAEDRDVPGSHVAGVDGAGARLERQHEAGERAGGGGGRRVRRGAAARGQPGHAHLRRQGRRGARHHDEPGQQLEALAGYKAEGGTALYDALCDSLLMLKGLKGRRAVVVLTDGRDEDNPGTGPGSVRTWDSVLRLLQDQDVTVFPVGLGTKIDPERLNLLATFSGGAGVLPAGGLGARRAVRARHREPAAPLHRRLHVHQSSARREVAQRRDPHPHARRPHHQPQGLLRTRAVGGPRDEARRPASILLAAVAADRGGLRRVEHAAPMRTCGGTSVSARTSWRLARFLATTRIPSRATSPGSTTSGWPRR